MAMRLSSLMLSGSVSSQSKAWVSRTTPANYFAFGNLEPFNACEAIGFVKSTFFLIDRALPFNEPAPLTVTNWPVRESRTVLVELEVLTFAIPINMTASRADFKKPFDVIVATKYRLRFQLKVCPDTAFFIRAVTVHIRAETPAQRCPVSARLVGYIFIYTPTRATVQGGVPRARFSR